MLSDQTKNNRTGNTGEEMGMTGSCTLQSTWYYQKSNRLESPRQQRQSSTENNMEVYHNRRGQKYEEVMGASQGVRQQQVVWRNFIWALYASVEDETDDDDYDKITSVMKHSGLHKSDLGVHVTGSGQ